MDDRTSGSSVPSASTPTPVPTATSPDVTVTTPSSPPEPVATAPAATTPPADAGGAAAPGPEDQEGGAGDEEGIRVPVDLTVSADAVSPPTVSVPAFLPIEVTARAGDGRAHRVEVAGATVQVPAAGTATARVDGLRRGTYPIAVDGIRRGELVAGDEPGP